MGTSDAARAVEVARLVQDDVFGIDVNMGCPKPFSVKGGMGSALLRQPESVRQILTALVQAFPHKPITCKIRLLPSFEETLALCEIIQSTGVVAVGVHGRFTEQVH
jgi:tRNA-dihydrouridine synthase 2